MQATRLGMGVGVRTGKVEGRDRRDLDRTDRGTQKCFAKLVGEKYKDTQQAWQRHDERGGVDRISTAEKIERARCEKRKHGRYGPGEREEPKVSGGRQRNSTGIKVDDRAGQGQGISDLGAIGTPREREIEGMAGNGTRVLRLAALVYSFSWERGAIFLERGNNGM